MKRIEHVMMRSKRLATLGVCALLLAAGCGPAFVDTDEQASKAAGLPTELTVSGELNFDVGDDVDWKAFAAEADGEARLEVRIGDPFVGKHSVVGSIVVFDRDANQLVSENITKTVLKYALTWPVKKDMKYLVRLMAAEGQSSYEVDLDLNFGPQDPCEDVTCEAGERCEDGECVPSMSCDPPCKSGRICASGECVRAKSKKPALSKNPAPHFQLAWIG